MSHVILLFHADNKRLNDKLHLFRVYDLGGKEVGRILQWHGNQKDLHLMRNIFEEGYNSSRETLRMILHGIIYNESAKEILARIPLHENLMTF